jgi:hypothetical protein
VGLCNIAKTRDDGNQGWRIAGKAACLTLRHAKDRFDRAAQWG